MKPLINIKQAAFSTRRHLLVFLGLAWMTLASARAQLVLTEVNSNAAGGDFWELTNAGATAQDIGGWKWIDNSASGIADPATVTIPGGTIIGAGESVVFCVAADAAAFRSYWGSLTGVQILASPSGPGLGQNDAINLFDASGSPVLSFTYAASGFTRSDGSASAGGHAGVSAGGAAAQSAVIDPAFGTGAGRRYKAASAGVNGAYASTSGGSNIGSPGVTGLSFSGGPSITLSLSITASTFSEAATNPAATGTVSRATSGTTDLVVTLSSSDTTEATVPATVTILANQTSATFEVSAVNDTFPDGSKTVTITASATDATTPTSDLIVTDDGDVLDTSFMLTEVQSSQSATKPSTANDYWELTNISGVTKDISGYSWHDSGRSGAAAQAYKLPPGTSITAGESVIFTAAPVADFRAWWGLEPTVQVFTSTGAPGLGQNDGISFFDAGQNELFFFSYAASGFTKEDGSPSTGGHAGPSGGGSADSQALIWVPASGTATPRYTAATGIPGNHGSFTAVSPATDAGSPGNQGAIIPTVSIANASTNEGSSGTTLLSLPVTRSSTATAFTVDYAVTGGTATSGTDFATLASGTLTFTNGGAASQNIDITVNGDTTSEADETVIITLSNLVNSAGATVIQAAAGTGTIVNDDIVPAGITTHPASVTIATGYTATLSVTAAGFPTPSFQWYQGSSGDTSTPVGSNSSSLTTPALTTTTSYWVRATNAGGPADSSTAVVTVTTGPTEVNLANYVRVARINLPEPTRTALPPGTPVHNYLCQEASAVTYNWDTDTLFVTGDGGRAITQVSKTGQLIDTMTLALGSSPQGTDFYDPEGLTYIGGGQFVMSEERDRQLVKFTYVAGTTLSRSGAQTVKIGTFVDNTGTEGLSWDPQTSGFICLKELSPIGIFQTGVDFVAGTATNGSPTTVNSTNLFDPALLGMTDTADVFALSNLPSMSGQPQAGNLLVLGQEDARIVNVDRSGVITSTLNISSDPGNPLTPNGQQHEGITMDRAGIIYVVNENGGGSIDYPQLWVYAPSSLPNAAPTAVIVDNSATTLPENSSTASRVKLGDIFVTDDGLGTNTLSLSGVDAASFELSGTEFFLKAGVTLDFETKSSYAVTVNADDSTVGTTPDASVNFTLTISDVEPEAPPAPVIIISEVAPWASSSSAVAADWFEITNVTSNTIDITGWKIDDSSAAFGSAATLNGVTTLAPGESAIFIETADLPAKDTLFRSTWFGENPPAGLQIGSYTGSGIGLSSTSDGVNIFNAAGTLMASVSFGASDAVSPFQTFDNTRGLNATTISQLSLVGTNGAIASSNAAEVGSPGFAAPGVLRITEVAAWGSGNGNYLADWFEVTNTGARAVDISGWKMDDSSESPAAALSLTGVTSIAPGESVIFLETATPVTTIATFRSTWFSTTPPPALQIGSYTGSGAGLSTGGDAVVLYDGNNVRQAKVFFGASPSATPFATFDNSIGADNVSLVTLSAVGTNGAFVALTDTDEIGSPGTTVSAAQSNTTIIISDASLSEGNSGSSTLSFTVTRSDRNGAFTVDFATSNGTATAGSDYTAASGTLTFTAGGSTTQNVSVCITGDTAVEANETFIVTLSNVVNTAGTATITDATGTGTISNDDTTPAAFPASNSLSSTVKGSIALAGAEIPAFDPLSDRAFASSGTGIQVVNLADPANPVFISTITPSTLGVVGLTSDDISSVAVRKGSGSNPSVLAAAIINNPKTSAGHVVFLNAATGALISHATVGVVPDHIAWTPDGSKLLVCNEGELSTPEVTIAAAVPDAAQGTVSIIAVDAAGVAGMVQTADFTAFDAQTAALKTAGVRLYDDGVPSTDFEPEYLAISPDGTKAMVTLQEANAVAVLDIASATFTSVAPLGKKDFSALRADFSDADGMKNPRTGQPVFGLYMPDAIASFSSGGQTYYVTANEGDDRNDFIAPNETTTVSNAGYDLDNSVFPNEADLKLNANLGKLTVSNLPGLRGDTDNDGDIDEILMYGARSFSILDSTGALVFDSGDMIEMIVASLHNSSFDDTRSDNKGPEPEGVAVATLGARTFAFVGLERSHLTLVFDVTNPLAPTYVTSLVRSGDLNPEGIVVVSEADSPSGRPLVLVTNESSNTLSIFELTPAAAFTLQLLHLADAEAGLLASQTAPNLAALVDAFDGAYANTLILAGGDNYIPGPFAAAGTDALVAATHNKGNNPFAADIEIHNRLGVEASTIGNHEFDFGTNAFSDAIADTNFPYLSSNLNFAGDSGISARYQETVGVGGLEEASSVKNKIVPSCVVTKGTEKIGLVGVTTQIIEAISSTGNVEVKGFVGDGSETDNMVLLASQVQPVINDLKSHGVNKIILMAHLQQIANELMLAPMLTDVDIILAAGSNTRLGDDDDVAVAFKGHAANFASNYPIYTAGADGKPTVVVNTDNEFTYLGRLVADFDADGVLIVPNLLANTALNGAYAATAANVASAWGVSEANLAATAFASGTKGALVKQITDAVQSVINTKDGDVRGYTNVYLEGERSFVRNQETNLGNISADSMVTVGKMTLPAATHVVALKNGGGIRAAIGAVEVATGAKLPPLANPSAGKPSGAVSLLDIENSMRFNNGLMLCETTPAGLKAILEHGVALLGNQGRFPQIGGMSFSFDASLPAGSRVRSVALTDLDGNVTAHIVVNGSVLVDAPASITLVTLNFLANNGDSYPFKANAGNFRYLLSGGGLSGSTDESLNFTAAGVVPANILGEQAALSSHLQARHATPASAYAMMDTPVALDTRIQQIVSRSDTVLSHGPISLASAVVTHVSGAPSVEVVIHRSGTAATSVSISTSDGTASVVPPFAAALAGVDYTAVSTVVNFAEGELSRSVSIPLLPRPASAPNRRFSVSLTSPAGGSTLGTITSAEVRILAADTLKPTLVVSSPSASVTSLSAVSPFQVKGTAGDARGIDRVELVLNGGPAVNAVLGSATAPASVPWSLDIEPLAGANTLAVTAYDLRGNASATVTRSFTFSRRYVLSVTGGAPSALALAGGVTLAATPSTAVSALTPSTAGASPRTSSILPGTAVKLTATAKTGYWFSHWARQPAGAVALGGVLTFTMPAEDVAAEAVFVANPLLDGSGRGNGYYGLLNPFEGVATGNGSVGFLTGTVTPTTGGFTGKVMIGGTTTPVAGAFQGDGRFLYTLGSTKSWQGPLVDGRRLELVLEVSDIRVNLRNAGDNAKEVTGLAQRAFYGVGRKLPGEMLNRKVPATAAAANQGFLTVALPAKAQVPAKDPASYPQGTGFGTVSWTNVGGVTFAGTLADGSTFTGSSGFVTSVQWPYFAMLETPGAAASAAKGGSFSGVLETDAAQAGSDVTGSGLLWIRPSVVQQMGTTAAAKETQLYTAGWPEGVRVDAVGAFYDEALDVPSTLGLGPVNAATGNGEMMFNGGKLVNAVLVRAFNVVAGATTGTSVVTKIPTSNSSFTLLVNQKLGTWSGTFTPDWTEPAAVKPAFKGVLLQKGAGRGGYGWFISNRSADLDPESGEATLGAQVP